MLASVAARWLPPQFVESSRTGGMLTLLTWALMFVAFCCELSSFVFVSYSTRMMLDEHGSDMIQLNFDVDMHDIECRNLEVVVYAQRSTERTALLKEQDFWLRSIDGNGRTYGIATKPGEKHEDEMREESEEAHQKKMKEVTAQDGQKEVDSDWSSSHDGLKHKSFEHVLQAHDFTMTNWFAEWCSHCRQFSPSWKNMSRDHNGDDGKVAPTFKDRDGKERHVRFIKINCVDFGTLCHERGIDAYPTIRLYKDDGTFSVYEGKREEADIIRWIEKTVRTKYGWSNDHEEFERGCNAKGRLVMPRVPGHLELKAGSGDQDLNTKMANVSHTIKHLSFSDPTDGRYHRQGWWGMPSEVSKHLNPLDGRPFVTKEFHQTWAHDFKVVSTRSPKGRTAYQFHHHKRIKKVAENVVPQARFDFDIEPFSIWVEKDSKKWYDFCTSILAIMGGLFVTMRVFSQGVLWVLSGVLSGDAALPTGSGK